VSNSALLLPPSSYALLRSLLCRHRQCRHRRNRASNVRAPDKHSERVKTSWHGESIGRYEGDTLVVDTIGLDDRTFLDGFNTPHTKELHVIERLHLIDGGEVLEANVHVEDPGAFTMPWKRHPALPALRGGSGQDSVERLSVLATPAEGPLTEAVCAENPNSFFAGQPAMLHTAGGNARFLIVRGRFTPRPQGGERRFRAACVRPRPPSVPQ
jgi:hypothetical protein